MPLFCSLILLLTFLIPNQNDTTSIFIAKSDWHVGIILYVNDNLIEQIKAIKDFEQYEFVDIGWGDSDFYQSDEEFDLYLAAKAILLPTPSVVRIKGYNYTIDEIINWRDYAFEVKLDMQQFNKLCAFIDESVKRDSVGSIIQTLKKDNTNVRFYLSPQKYHAMNTCNTWVAEALEEAGTNIKSSEVITAEELYEKLLSVGVLLK